MRSRLLVCCFAVALAMGAVPAFADIVPQPPRPYEEPQPPKPAPTPAPHPLPPRPIPPAPPKNTASMFVALGFFAAFALLWLMLSGRLRGHSPS